MPGFASAATPRPKLRSSVRIRPGAPPSAARVRLWGPTLRAERLPPVAHGRSPRGNERQGNATNGHPPGQETDQEVGNRGNGAVRALDAPATSAASHPVPRAPIQRSAKVSTCERLAGTRSQRASHIVPLGGGTLLQHAPQTSGRLLPSLARDRNQVQIALVHSSEEGLDLRPAAGVSNGGDILPDEERGYLIGLETEIHEAFIEQAVAGGIHVSLQDRNDVSQIALPLS